MTVVEKYFPHLSPQQYEKYEGLPALYEYWNDKINLISRKDIQNIDLHHILHSLAIAHFIQFVPGSRILDVGCGGGFPGIPLAIMFPEVDFTLIDSIGKKINVVNHVAAVCGLTNIKAYHRRAQDETGIYDFVISRAAMTLPQLEMIVRKNFSRTQRNPKPNGIICLKGGLIQEEIAPFGKLCEVEDISDFFFEDYFEAKKVVYLCNEFFSQDKKHLR